MRVVPEEATTKASPPQGERSLPSSLGSLPPATSSWEPARPAEKRRASPGGKAGDQPTWRSQPSQEGSFEMASRTPEATSSARRSYVGHMEVAHDGDEPSARKASMWRWHVSGGAPPDTPADLRVCLDVVMWCCIMGALTATVLGILVAISSRSAQFLFPGVLLLAVPLVFRWLNKRGLHRFSRVAVVSLFYCVTVANFMRKGSEDPNAALLLIPLAMAVLLAFRHEAGRLLASAFVFATFVYLELGEWEPAQPELVAVFGNEVKIAHRTMVFVFLVGMLKVATKEREALIAWSKVVEAEMDNAHQANAELEREGEAKMRFLTIMSHEIRTPLNGVIGLTDVLIESLAARASVAADLDLAKTIASSSQSLLTIVNDLLDFSRVDAGHLSLVNSAVDLGALLENVCHGFTALAEGKRLELVCDVRLPLAYAAMTDPVRVQQIVSNFLGNAIKFTGSGAVRVCAELLPNDGGVRIAVEDTGSGIPEHALPTIFEPFTQAEQTTKRRFDGTGLGLAIVKRIVHVMGGRIGVESTVDVGTNFWVVLPLEQVAMSPAQRQPQRLRRAMNVVVMASQPFQRSAQALLRTVASMGCRASFARTRSLGRFGDVDLVLMCSTCVADVDAMRVAFPKVPVLTLAPLSASVSGPTLALPVRRRALLESLLAVQGGTPLAAAPHRPLPGPLGAAATPPTPLAGVRVLVAEDNTVNQRVISAMLKSLGCEAAIVADGAQCVSAFAASQGKVQVVLMDCHMPVMDGFEATRAIRKVDAQVPILALTADVFAEASQRALQAGMNAVLTKPVSKAVLAEALLQAVAPSSPHPSQSSAGGPSPSQSPGPGPGPGPSPGPGPRLAPVAPAIAASVLARRDF